MSSIVAKRYYDNYVSMADEDNLAPEKLAELKNCFGSFDRNGDGTISANEFQNALIRMNIYIPADVQFFLVDSINRGTVFVINKIH